MKLFTSDNAELMDVCELRSEDGNLIVVGTIMGAMPTEAVLTPAELRASLKLLNLKILLALVRMLFSRVKP
jgi:hypothetical protein